MQISRTLAGLAAAAVMTGGLASAASAQMGLSEVEYLALQQELRDRGCGNEHAGGQVDAATRQAIRTCAQRLGVAADARSVLNAFNLGFGDGAAVPAADAQTMPEAAPATLPEAVPPVDAPATPTQPEVNTQPETPTQSADPTPESVPPSAPIGSMGDTLSLRPDGSLDPDSVTRAMPTAGSSTPPAAAAPSRGTSPKDPATPAVRPKIK